ncbi:MAG: methyltransferase [Desulfomonilaceae bacterium]
MVEALDTRAIDLMSVGFQKARIILSAAELDIFSKFHEGPRSAANLCEAHGWNHRGVQILLDALASLGLLQKNDERYSVDPSVSRLLDSNSEESILPMLLHRSRMWKSWSNLTSIVTGSFDMDSFVKRNRSRDDIEAFIGAMDVVGRKRAQRIAKEINLQGRKNLLDIGAGSGVYSRALLEINPELSATLFDLPIVIEINREINAKTGFANRIHYIEGDFNIDPLPAGHDTALLSAIIHMNGREKNRSLFSKVYQALEPNGVLIIRDHIMQESRISPADGAIFAVNMLVATREGNSYTFKEISDDLIMAGFQKVKLARCGTVMDQLVTATK